MITVDIQRFSTHLAAIYANIAKPILDVVLYNYQLSRNVGAEGLVLLVGLVQASAALCVFMFLLRRLHPWPNRINQCGHWHHPLENILLKRQHSLGNYAIHIRVSQNSQKRLLSSVVKTPKRCYLSETTLALSSTSIGCFKYEFGME